MVSPPFPDDSAAPLQAFGGGSADALIELLHRLQEQRGWLDRETLRQAARQLRLPFSHVVGVASFYHLFLLQRPTPHRCAVCLGSACFVRGAMPLARLMATRLDVELDDPHGNGAWSLQRVGCLGACGQAPVLVVDDRLLSHMPLEAAALDARLRAAGLPEARQPAPSQPEARRPAAVNRPEHSSGPLP